MVINGREIGLRYTVGVNIWMQEFALNEPDTPATRLYMLMAVKMSEAYARTNGGEALTEEELIDMDLEDFARIKDEIDVVMKLDSKTTVEAQEPKGKGKKKESAGKRD